jgi:hypothetical protein
MDDLGIIKLKVELPLGRWMRCMCGHRWDRYPAEYVAEVSGRNDDGDVTIKFDCPKCHSWHITQDPERPAEVPEDWVLVDCQNPQCPQTVWVPPDWMDVSLATPVKAVCSSECALVLVRDEGFPL